MALSTKGLADWADSIRNIFQMPEPPSSKPERSPSPPEPGLDASENEASDSDIESIDESNQELDLSLPEKMDIAKQRYPGAKEWAKDEERLFEILYLRQDLPILPSHWKFDFRGFPLPENIFETSEEHPPIIYSQTKTRAGQFRATNILSRLIDLTLAVRTAIESEPHTTLSYQGKKREKAAYLIKERLDQVLKWAAKDGGYNQLRIVPNIIAEVIETSGNQTDIEQCMTSRMHALAKRQRDYLRIGDDDETPPSANSHLMKSDSKSWGSLCENIRAGMKRKVDETPSTPGLYSDEVDDPLSPSPDSLPTPKDGLPIRPNKRQLVGSPCAGRDEVGKIGKLGEPIRIKKEKSNGNERADTAPKMSDIPSYSLTNPPKTPPAKVKYRRTPPVVYGLFVLGTTVFLLTADSAKGDAAYISFQVSVNFADNYQSVWNALTLAVAVCSARDELMTRLEDFRPISTLPRHYDPDA